MNSSELLRNKNSAIFYEKLPNERNKKTIKNNFNHFFFDKFCFFDLKMKVGKLAILL